MPDEMTTKPTIETVLERINTLEEKIDRRFDTVDERFNRVDERFNSIDNEIDRVASVTYATKSEMATLRVDFRELRAQLKDVLPAPQAS